VRAPTKGYYLYPDIHGDELAFVSDDDVWITSFSQVQPRRLTVGFGVVTKPRFSPDCKWIAFKGRKGTDEVVAEVYVIPSEGGEARRLTYFGSALTLARATSGVTRVIDKVIMPGNQEPDSSNLLFRRI
jgi:tricorn protease